MSPHPDLATIAARVAAFDREHRRQVDPETLAPVRDRDGELRPPRRAAVAVVVLHDPTRWSGVLLTRRTSRLRDHPGQFALPGGSVDPGEGNATTNRAETSRVSVFRLAS